MDEDDMTGFHGTGSSNMNENMQSNNSLSHINESRKLGHFILSRPESECFPEPFENGVPFLFRTITALIRQNFEGSLWRLFVGFSQKPNDKVSSRLSNTNCVNLPRILTWEGLERLATAHNIFSNPPRGAHKRGKLSKPKLSNLNLRAGLSTGITQRQLQKMLARLIQHRKLAQDQSLHGTRQKRAHHLTGKIYT